MNPIIVESPTRVDLAGGTLDLWPLYNFVGGAMTANVAIDIKTRVELQPRSDQQVILESQDLAISKTYSNVQEALKDTDSKVSLLQAQLRFWQPQKGFHLKTSSQSPVGGGLGGSSSLTVSLMKAFAQFEQKPFLSVHKLVDCAHNIEAEVLNTPTGTQDYYPAASGGVNILKYTTRGIEQEVLNFQDSPLQTHFLLVYTGRSHHSGLNNFEVMKAAVGKELVTTKALWDLKVIAEEMAQTLRAQKWEHLPSLFQREYEARVQLSPAFTCPEIEELNRLSLQLGAGGVKICGAGGGGCVMVWVPPVIREKVLKACQTAGFKTLDAKPVAPLPTNA